MEQGSHITIYRARWVVPVSSPPIEDGAVCTYEDAIVEVGPAHEIASRYSGRQVELEGCTIVPGLVNAHSHLELSALKWRMEPTGSFTTWVRNLMRAREAVRPSDAMNSAIKALEEMYETGIAALHDVGNSWFLSGILASFRKNDTPMPPVLGFSVLEIISPLERERQNISAMLAHEDSRQGPGQEIRRSFSAHAGFTVAPETIRDIKGWTREHALPFSIHAAESPEEIEFFARGSGPIAELLRERGHWPLDWSSLGPTPVTHLDALGVLDPHTILVHCVHLDRRDMEIIRSQGAWACLCPRSNTFIGVGEPAVAQLFSSEIKICIGTDSLASNDRLSMWHEMKALSSMAPAVDPARMMAAATISGAEALGMEGILGSLERGKLAKMALVKGSPQKGRELYDWLVHAPAAGEVGVEPLP